MEKLLGCSNHDCVFRDNRRGLGTNASCNCVTNLMRDGGTKERIALERHLRSQNKEIERLRRVEEAAKDYLAAVSTQYLDNLDCAESIEEAFKGLEKALEEK